MIPPEWVEESFRLAEEADAEGETPVGAIVVDRDGRIIGRGRNRRERDHDPLAHAELIAIREAAAATGDWRLEGTTLVVTLEPCAMCAGAIVNARISRLVFSAWDPKGGFCGSLGNLVNDPRLNHRVETISGIGEERSRQLLQRFFQRLRSERKATKQVEHES